MPVSFRILPDIDLVHVRYHGEARVMDTMAAIRDYRADPEYRPGLNHLVDLSGSTGYETEFFRISDLNTVKEHAFLDDGSSIRMIYVAPTKIAREIAENAVRSWISSKTVKTSIVGTQNAAIELLGLDPDKTRARLIPAHSRAAPVH